MNYRLVVRPEVDSDLQQAEALVQQAKTGAGPRVSRVMREAMSRLQRNPLLHPIRRRRKQVRWSYPRRFPYRIVFRVLRETVVIYAVLRAARHDSHWQQRIDR